MVYFFKNKDDERFGVETYRDLEADKMTRLQWLLGDATEMELDDLMAKHIGPRREMITPWSTNAVEIAANMGIDGIRRIEKFVKIVSLRQKPDPMLQSVYEGLTDAVFRIDKQPEPITQVANIAEYNREQGLALSPDEIQYLEGLQEKLQRPLTDSEIFGFSQINSEHCRHKIFGGKFVIDGEEKADSLFAMIKKTSETNPNRIVSAYKDNCAFLSSSNKPSLRFTPETPDQPSYFRLSEEELVLSLKAETHNFPTTVEPFNGAATGSGGEIRDRLAGGRGSTPLAGTAVYMTSYPRFAETKRAWEQTPARTWLYQSPLDILIKASNGASDFGNKFGQPLICGSVLTFEHRENDRQYGFDKVIMLAGGIGFARKQDAIKQIPENGKLVLLGGDNYRIGMGGGAVSSVATGEYDNAIELNAVQRSNPEMQKRVANAIRALAESPENPIISIHDHGAGGHLNCLSELIENTGGRIDISALPVGDPTLSAKELLGNESQERMGLVLEEEHLPLLQRIAERERAPMYVVGEITHDKRFLCENPSTGERPIDLALEDMFGNTPKTVLTDSTIPEKFEQLSYDPELLKDYLNQVLQLEAVACKDWLTNKVDRSVTGLVAQQQTVGEIQLPLSNFGLSSLDYQGSAGIATSIGHAPGVALLDAPAGSRMAITEALTNLVWAQIDGGLKSVSLSANWMWPCKHSGEDARLYSAVKAASDFAIELGINIPTGKDSLSMTQKYPDGQEVFSPGTVIISTVAPVADIRNLIRPVMKKDLGTQLIYLPLGELKFPLGGSALAQVLNVIGDEVPDIKDTNYFARAFEAVQILIKKGLVLAGHDVSAGGLITTLLEMNFPNKDFGCEIDLTPIAANSDLIRVLFSEAPALVLQVHEADSVLVHEKLHAAGLKAFTIGRSIEKRILRLYLNGEKFKFEIDSLRDKWFKTSYLLDCRQSGAECALERFSNYKFQPLKFNFPKHFKGSLSQFDAAICRKEKSGVRAAIIREKGSQCDRETAWMLHLAGFDVKDVHTSDLVAGREDLRDVNMIVFVGGFSNSDVLGSAKGWAGALKYSENAQKALREFYARPDTLSLGICNGCQLMIELGLISPADAPEKPKMAHNNSHKFESNFVNVSVPENRSVMLSSMAGARLGIWVAHGEGKFVLPQAVENYNVVLKYSYDAYPANPNGSVDGIAALCSDDGRHIAMMPHPERAIYPWNWPFYPEERQHDEVSPWLEMFRNAAEWILEKNK